MREYCYRIALLSLFLTAKCSPARGLFTKKRTILTWVNGIGHNLDHMNDGQTSISSFFGGKPVVFCHNPTAMTREDDYVGYIGDLTQAGTQKLGRITAEVNSLVKHLKEAVQNVGPKGCVVHIAHSQGALITYLASKHLTKKEMAQIEVVCFGGAEVIRRSKEFPFARCINYYSVNDPLLFVVPAAARALRSGFLGIGDSNSISSLELKPSEPEFVFLTPRVGDPILDHSLFGPTYIDVLTWEGRRYQRLYLPIWHPVVRTIVLHSLALQTTISDALKSVIRAILHRIILPFIAFTTALNSWIKDRVFVPFILFLKMLLAMFKEAIRIWKGENVYEPVVTKEPKKEQPA